MNRWLYAKVTKNESAVNSGLTNTAFHDILNLTKKYLSQAFSSDGDQSTIDYRLSPDDIDFIHHSVGSVQADPNLDVVIEFTRELAGGLHGGETHGAAFTEAGKIMIAMYSLDSDGNMVRRTNEQIALSLAHELGHQAGLPDVVSNAGRVRTPSEKEAGVGPTEENLMKQAVTGEQGPALSKEQQKKVEQNIDRSNSVARPSFQEHRSERNSNNNGNNSNGGDD